MLRPGGAFVVAVALAIAATTAGCSSTVSSNDASAEVPATLAIRGLRIRNELPYAVTDVLVTVPATGAFAGCSNVLAHTECSTSFRSMAYRGNPMVVTWKERGKPQHTDEFVVEEPEDLLPGADARLDVIIFAPGQAGAKLAEFESQNPGD